MLRKLLVRAVTVVAAAAATLGAAQAIALPVAPPPVAPVSGIPEPCAVTAPWPGDDVAIETIASQITETFGFKLAGSQWSEENRASIKILWETLDAVSCTDYVVNLQTKVNGNVGINANRISGWAWGDWSLTKGSYVTLDFAKFAKALDAGDEGRLVRLVIHEIAHVLNSDRHSNPEYWQEFGALFNSEGRFGDYAGSSKSETFADVVGYYVGRCALNNPYDTGEFAGYYEFVKQEVFDGKEFGPEPGVKPECAVPDADAEEPKPGATESDGAISWIEAVSGE